MAALNCALLTIDKSFFFAFVVRSYMRIILNETETGTDLQLEAHEVTTPTGMGWSVLSPQGISVVIKLIDGNWQAADAPSISQEFWQILGEEISRILDQGQPKATAIVPLKRYVSL